jgi:acyl carrier protein
MEERMTRALFTPEDLKAILVEHVGLTEADVPDRADAALADLGLDSLAVVELQVALQSRFAFEIPDEDVQRIDTLRDAVDYVNRRLGAPEAA